MGRVIVVGETCMKVTFDGARPVASVPGGCLFNVAAKLGESGADVSFVSETGADRPGDMAVGYLTSRGVDVKSVDRYTDGATPVELEFDGQDTVRYEHYSEDEGLDVIWPRMEPSDVLVFGEYMALSPRVRARLWQLVTHAKERKIRIVYIPGNLAGRESRITRVMPTLFENLEIADEVITAPEYNRYIFGNDDAASVYRNNVSFYCDRMTDVDIVAGRVARFGAGDTESVCCGDIVEAIVNEIIRISKK